MTEPTTEEQSFTRLIRARPADDAPRLIAADWYEDHGQPERAEFIRLQCEKATLADTDARWQCLDRREAALLAEHGARWADPIQGLAQEWHFRRGFIEAITIDTRAFIQNRRHLFQWLPLRRVRLGAVREHLNALVRCPGLSRLAELDLSENLLGDAGLRLLLDSPQLGKLTRLNLRLNNLSDTTARRLAGSARVRHLLELHLGDNPRIGDEGASALALSPLFERLTRLDLTGDDVGAAGLRALAQDASLRCLCELGLRGNHVGDAGVEALVRSPLLARMLQQGGVLDLRSNTIGPVGAQALACSPAVAGLVELRLDGNFLKDSGVQALLASPYLRKLSVLSLGHNELTDRAALALADSPVLTGLQLLDVSGNRIGPVGRRALSTSPHLNRAQLEI